MADAQVLGRAKRGKAALPATFAEAWNEHLVWHVVRNELAARRQGTSATKTRGMVSGGGAKPWRQKGTGRARQGTRRAPQWAGGGVVFGPSPRTHGGKVNRKERIKALHAALSLQHGRGTLGVIADDAFGETPSAKKALDIFRTWDAPARAKQPKCTVICTLEQESVWKSFRNLANVLVVASSEVEVADVLWGHRVLVTESALKAFAPKEPMPA